MHVTWSGWSHAVKHSSLSYLPAITTTSDFLEKQNGCHKKWGWDSQAGRAENRNGFLRKGDSKPLSHQLSGLGSASPAGSGTEPRSTNDCPTFLLHISMQCMQSAILFYQVFPSDAGTVSKWMHMSTFSSYSLVSGSVSPFQKSKGNPSPGCRIHGVFGEFSNFFLISETVQYRPVATMEH